MVLRLREVKVISNNLRYTVGLISNSNDTTADNLDTSNVESFCY